MQTLLRSTRSISEITLQNYYAKYNKRIQLREQFENKLNITNGSIRDKSKPLVSFGILNVETRNYVYVCRSVSCVAYTGTVLKVQLLAVFCGVTFFVNVTFGDMIRNYKFIIRYFLCNSSILLLFFLFHDSETCLKLLPVVTECC